MHHVSFGDTWRPASESQALLSWLQSEDQRGAGPVPSCPAAQGQIEASRSDLPAAVLTASLVHFWAGCLGLNLVWISSFISVGSLLSCPYFPAFSSSSVPNKYFAGFYHRTFALASPPQGVYSAVYPVNTYSIFYSKTRDLPPSSLPELLSSSSSLQTRVSATFL